MKPYLVHDIDKIQLAANSYLCFPTAPKKERKGKKRQMMRMWVKICFRSLMNLEAKPSIIDNDFFTYLSCVARLCKQLEEGL